MGGSDGTGVLVLMLCLSGLYFLQVVGVILGELRIAAAGLLGKHRGPCFHAEEAHSTHVGFVVVVEARTGIVIEVDNWLVVVVVVVALNKGHLC